MGRRALIKARRRVVNAYLAGVVVQDIARQENVAKETIYRVLRQERVVRSTGETLRGRSRDAVRKYRVNEAAFVVRSDRHMTSEQAYWIGFLMADGNVSANAIQIALAPKDVGHLRKFRRFLHSTHPIRTIAGYPRLHVGSVALVKSLTRWGVIPNKSLIACAMNSIDRNRHFWRGVVDGDGSLYWGGTDAECPVLRLTGSKPLLTQFVAFVRREIGKSEIIKKRPDAQAYDAGFHGRYARALTRVLYDRAQTYLDRKMTLALRWR